MPDYLAFRRVYRNDLFHVGKGHDDNPPGRGSGRYPWGSGKKGVKNRKYDSEYKLKKYTSPMRENLKNLPTQILQVIPGLNLIVAVKYSIDFINYRFDNKDYVKKEGMPEKIRDLKKKEEETSILDDMKKCNPRIGNQKGKINNCVNCTVAMEMRQRGYDVQARSSGKGTSGNAYKQWFKDAKMEHERYSKEKKESRKEYVNRSYDDLCNKIEKCGNGSRGCVLVTYDLSVGSGSGHAMYWKVDNGRVTFYDGQNNSIDKTDRVFALSDPSFGYSWYRLDNLKLKEAVTERVVSRKVGK